MPTKREVLAVLGRDDLLACLNHYSLEVRDRRVKDELVDALASSRKARLDELLATLSRDSLKAACRALGLDDAGKEKVVLVERLVNGHAASTPPEAFRNGSPAQVAEHDLPAGRLTTEQLERYLWSAADILRGQIDSGDYKGFIFAFLFLKRLSDRFEEEVEKLLAEGHSSQVAWEDHDEHEFFVPKRARWREIQKVARHLRDRLVCTVHPRELVRTRRCSPAVKWRRGSNGYSLVSCSTRLMPP